MIVRPRLHWLRMLFVLRGSVLPRIIPQLLFTTALSAAVVWSNGRIGEWKLGLTAAPFTLLGVALAIFLGFRNNASYERYWEARKLWGALINEGRTLARQVCTLTSCTPEERQRLIYILIAFAHALRGQLRGEQNLAQVTSFVPAGARERIERARFKPAVLLVVFSEELAAVRRVGRIEPILAAAFEPPLAGLSQVLVGCERIANTPIPFTYSVIIHRIIYLYCFLLPFGLVDTVGTFTPLVVAFVAYTFFALEALSDEIEEPFGTMPNDLALDAMSRVIETTLRETLDERDLPPSLSPDAQCVLR